MNKCPMCETRAILRKMNELLDTAPEIHSAHYDDEITELSNMINNTISWFECMCQEIEAEQ